MVSFKRSLYDFPLCQINHGIKDAGYNLINPANVMIIHDAIDLPDFKKAYPAKVKAASDNWTCDTIKLLQTGPDPIDNAQIIKNPIFEILSLTNCLIMDSIITKETISIRNQIAKA
jgi:hypothetical protein